MQPGASGSSRTGRRAAWELGVLVATLEGLVCLWARLPSWIDQLGRLQMLAALSFAVYVLLLRRIQVFERLARPLLVLLVVSAVLRLTLILVPPVLSDDIYRYLWEGRVLLHGADPYRLAPSHPALAHLRDTTIYPRINHPELATIYPPLSLAGFAIPAAIWPTVVGMKAWVVLWDLGVVAALGYWLRSLGRSPLWAAAYAWNPLLLVEYAGNGHNDPCAILGLVLALAWAERRPLASAAALSVGVLTKLAPILALPFLLRRWPWRARLLALGSCGAGLGLYASWARGPDSGLQAYWRSWRNNDLLFHYLHLWVGDAVRARVAALILLALMGVVLWLKRSRPDSASRWLNRAGLLLSPTAHPWYWGWPLVHEPLGISWPWLLLSLTAFLSYGVLRAPAEGTGGHLPLGWRWVEYGLPLTLALGLELAKRRRSRPSR